MTFMEPQADMFTAYKVETSYGTEIVPADLVGDDPSAEDLSLYCEGTPRTHYDGEPDMTKETGWYVRFSAPGYMDRTDWQGPYATEAEALADLAETFDVCPKCWECCWESDSPCDENDDDEDDEPPARLVMDCGDDYPTEYPG